MTHTVHPECEAIEGKISAEKLITENIDIWTSAIKKRGSQGRGSSKKIELYGIKKLRELILELAVRGLLVPQDPSDEPASVLLEKIAAEKEQLIKEKVIRNAKLAEESEMPSVKFDVPRGWKLPLLNDLILNSSDDIVDGPFGSKLKASEYVDEGIPIIRIQNIGRNVFKDNGLQYLTEEKAASLSRHAFNAGDVVLNKLGEPTGKVCLVPDAISQGIIVADIIRIRLNEEYHDKQYIVHCMNSPIVAYQFSGLAKGVTRQRVNLSQVRSLKVPLPPLKEQRRIVGRVDELMALCDQLEQQTESSLSAHQTLVETLLNTLLNADQNSFDQAWERIAQHFDVLFTTEHSIDQLKQTILQLAVMGKLVPQDPNDEPASVLLEKIAAEKEQLIKDKVIKKQKPLPPIGDNEKPFELPDGWEWSRVALMGIGSTGKTPKTSMTECFGGNIPFIGPGQITPSGKLLDSDKTLTEVGLGYSTEANIGDILMVCIGGSIGKASIADKRISFNQQINALQPLIASSGYLYIAMTSNLFYQSVLASSTGSATPIINRMKWEELLVPLPPEAEQPRIVAKVDELMTLCDELKVRLQESQTTQLHLADAMAEQALNS